MLAPTSLLDNKAGSRLLRTRPGTDTRLIPQGNSVSAEWGNYVIVNPSHRGNFLHGGMTGAGRVVSRVREATIAAVPKLVV